MELEQFLKERGYTREFCLAVMDEADAIPDAIPKKELARRRDFTDHTIVTIDGADSKDLDDAVSVTRQPDGTYQLGVHIADVSHYVTEGSVLDAEAFDRGTSVYLVDTVIPMLPQKLSNGICSLNPNLPRLTLSVLMTIDGSGSVLDYDICESVIQSKARMTYDKVSQILDGAMAARNEYQELVPTFELMRELALILRDKRMRRGAIDFDFPEPVIVTNDEGAVQDVRVHNNTIANKMIEEFMLAANETVAKHLCKHQLPGVYRVHEQPDAAKVESFSALMKSLGIRFKAGKDVSPKTMQTLLFRMDGTQEQLIVSTTMLRAMMKARYSEENLGHFGLAADYYCHFTSPIRRYPDLMVHRILKESLKGKLTKTRLRRYGPITRQAAERSSETEVNATMAERDFVDFKMCEYMADKVGMVFDGVICSVTSFGFFVQLPNLVEGLVRMVDLKDDYYLFDELRLTLTGRRGGQQFRMGQPVKVQLAKVNLELKQIDFVLAQPEEKKKETKKEVKQTHGRKNKGKRRSKGGKKTGRSKQKGVS